MDEWLAPTFNRHAQKIWKKNKCKRMVRKIGKKTDKSFDGSAVAISLATRDTTNDKEEQEERERDKAEREERLQKNREWRLRRQTGHNEPNKREKIIIDKDARNEKIQQMFVCVSCGETVEAGRAVWTCGKAHLCCGDCLDLDLLEDTKRVSESGIEDDISSLQTISGLIEDKEEEEETVSAHTFSYRGSYMRPSLDRIDFFKNTLDIRKDAITPYSDYNALDEGNSQDLSLQSRVDSDVEVASQERETYNKYLEEECPPPYASSLVEEEELRPVTLEVTLQGGDGTDDDPLSWRQKFERKKKEIDFFENTLDIRKNAIESYSDYKMNGGNIQIDSSSSEEDDSEDDTDYDSSEEDDSSDGLVSDCPQCGARDWRRNDKMEKMIEIFNTMMEYRNNM